MALTATSITEVVVSLDSPDGIDDHTAGRTLPGAPTILEDMAVLAQLRRAFLSQEVKDGHAGC
jgi:hypothetical protein